MATYTNRKDQEYTYDYGLTITAEVASVPLSSKTSISVKIHAWYGYVNYLDYVTVGIIGGPSENIYRGSGGHSGSSDDPISTTSIDGSVNLEWDPATMSSCTVYALPHIDSSYSGNTPERLTVDIPTVGATCDISLNTSSIYAGGDVSLRCTTDGNIRSGTVRRYYRTSGSSGWQSTVIASNVTGRSTSLSDSIPSTYGGYQVYWRYEINNGEDYAVTPTKTVTSNSAPSTPATLTVPNSLAAGASFAVSWSASTDPDGNLAGYILERSINGGSSWTQVYKGAALTTNDTLVAGTTRVRYRVKAYDTYGAESGYKNAPSSGGDYTVSNNQAPTVPASPITVTPASLTVGVQAVITWGASTDPDGDAFNYVLERSVDGLTNYQAIYTGTGRNYTDEVGSWSTVSYRVKAVDVHGASSDYRTADTKTVSANSVPTLKIMQNGTEISDGAELGSFSAVFSLTYQVNDANADDTLTVKEIVDGVTKRTRTGATRGTSYTFNFQTGSAASTSYWNKVLNGSHTVVIEVSDGSVTVRKAISFIKISSGLCVITLPAAIPTDQYPAVVALSISGYIPAATLADADKFMVEVTADGTNWERCDVFRESSAAVHGRKRGTTGNVNAELYGGHYLFLHKISHPGQVFNFRISVGGVSGEVTHIDSVHWAFNEAATSAAVASAVFNGVVA